MPLEYSHGEGVTKKRGKQKGGERISGREQRRIKIESASESKAPMKKLDWNSFSKNPEYNKLDPELQKSIKNIYDRLHFSFTKQGFLTEVSKYINNKNKLTLDIINRIGNVLNSNDNKHQAHQDENKVKEFLATGLHTIGVVATTAAASYGLYGSPISVVSDGQQSSYNTPSEHQEHEEKRETLSDKKSNDDVKKVDSQSKLNEDKPGEQSQRERLNNDIINIKQRILTQIEEAVKDEETKTWFKRNINKIIKIGPEFNNWIQNDTICNGMSFKFRFIKETNPRCDNLSSLDSDFQRWNETRINEIGGLFNHETALIFAENELTNKTIGSNATISSLGGGESSQELKKREERERKIVESYSRYTKAELIGEIVSKLDLTKEYNMLLLQYVMTGYLKKENMFDTDFADGTWNPDTQKFLEDLINDQEFKKDPNSKKYENTINSIIDKLGRNDTSKTESKFESFSESVRRDREYWENPEAFWRKQTFEGQREFVGISNTLQGGGSYKEREKTFLKNNMKEFNGKISEFLSLPKLEDGVTPNEETKDKMDQIWNAIPIEQLNSIYEKFASNPEEQKKFEEFLKNNNLPSIDLQDNSLKNFVVKKNLSLNPAAEYCYQRLWTCLQEQITGEAGKTLQYLSDKTGDTAFNIKNKVLEFFLPGISIHPENSEDGIFYFRDENNLDTLYGFNPEDGKIFQKGNISLGEDGIIKFGANEAEGNLLKQIHGFQDMISFELGDILPNKNADSVDELEKQITKKIESKINVESVVDTSVVSQALLKKENEKNVCRDRIVGDIKYLLDIERSELHSGDGEKYKIFRSLVKTFEKIKVENPNDNTPLVIMKDFLDKVYSSANQGVLLKPSNNGENTEERGDDNLPQEGENGSIENQPQEIWKTILLKNLIDPQTQLFDISLITALNQDKEINDFLAKRDFNNVIGKIAKRKDLQELDKDTDNQISQLTEKTGEELRGLYEETQLLASIDALEKQGDFLS